MAQPYVCVHSVKMLYEPASSEGKVAHGFGFRASRKEGRLRRANGGPGPGTGARRLQFSTLLVNFTAGETFSTEAQPTRTSDFDAETSGTESHINNNSIYNSSINGTVVAGIEVEWYVGGASVVDCTFLAWHLPPPPGSAPTTPNIDPAQAQLSTADWTHYMTTLEAPGLTDKFLSTCKRDIAESPLHLRAADRRHNYNIYRDRGYLQQSFPILASPSFAGESRWKASSDGSAVARESSSTYTEAEEVKSSTATHVADDVTRPLTTYKASVQPAFHMVGNAKVHSTVAFPPGRYLLVSWSMVDQHFGEPQQGYPSDLGPQSHLANVRTNPRYHKTVGDRIAQGRLFWPSDPLEVVVSSNGTYYVASTVIHGAWWDRQHHGNMHVDDNSQLYATGLEPEKTNSTLYGAGTVATDLLRNIFDTAAYLPAGEMQGNVKRLYVISFGLLLITGVCCVVLYYQWRRSSIYSQVANNKYVNFSSLRNFRSGKFSSDTTALSPAAATA